jgi:hypothetical protein
VSTNSAAWPASSDVFGMTCPNDSSPRDNDIFSPKPQSPPRRSQTTGRGVRGQTDYQGGAHLKGPKAWPTIELNPPVPPLFRAGSRTVRLPSTLHTTVSDSTFLRADAPEMRDGSFSKTTVRETVRRPTGGDQAPKPVHRGNIAEQGKNLKDKAKQKLPFLPPFPSAASIGCVVASATTSGGIATAASAAAFSFASDLARSSA